MDDYSTERFEVIRHHDAKGTWYRVIDKRNANATIKAFRGQKVAHRFCRETNAGWRRVRRLAGGDVSASGSDWFHEGMPS